MSLSLHMYMYMCMIVALGGCVSQFLLVFGFAIEIFSVLHITCKCVYVSFTKLMNVYAYWLSTTRHLQMTLYVFLVISETAKVIYLRTYTKLCELLILMHVSVLPSMPKACRPNKPSVQNSL